MKYYLVGIKGAGMSALALYLKSKGYDVVGSDISKYFFTEDKLIENNINILEYDSNNITNEYIYIIGLSINEENLEFEKIKDLGLIYYYYNDYIKRFVKERLIAVSGTHGKTTTSYLIKQMADISYIIGCGEGEFKNSTHLVLEACEYQNHFLSYNPRLLIIQSLDYDHPDFFKNKKELINSYQKMASNSEMVLINGDDPNSKKIKHSNIIRYGINIDNDFIIKNIEIKNNKYEFNLEGFGINIKLYCNILGLHNLRNYVAAYLSLYLLNIDVIKKDNFILPRRRMTRYQYNRNILIDDYAHHPNEIISLYESIRLLYPHNIYKYKVIFQSHTYSRTYKFKKSFKEVLKVFDEVYLKDIFSSSREKENKRLQKKLDLYFNEYKKYTNECLLQIDGSKDEVWIFLGAGDTNLLIDELRKNNNNIIKL